MLRLTVCCILLGVALAKPGPQNTAHSSENSADASENTADASENSADASENTADASENTADSSENTADASENTADASENSADSSENPGSVILYPTDPDSYKFTSPNYPNDYPNNSTFNKHFRHSRGGRKLIFALCTNFNLEDSPGCVNDYLMLNGQKFCGSGITPKTVGYDIFAEFKSNGNATDSGFVCRIGEMF